VQYQNSVTPMVPNSGSEMKAHQVMKERQNAGYSAAGAFTGFSRPLCRTAAARGFLRTQMNTAHIKLTEQERTTIVNALTVAARQYEIDAERASELALHGMSIFEPARELAKRFQELATDARQLRDKITFLWDSIQL
jgi:hypothetical protein